MTIPILHPGGSLPANIERLAEVIKDYDETLELRWIPPEVRTGFDSAPFAVWQVAPGIPEYMVMSLREDECDHRVVSALFNANNHNGNVLDRIEADEAAKKAIDMREEMAKREEQQEFMKFVLQSSKTVKHNGRVYT